MKMKIIIEGMSCSHCANHVKEALLELKGITNINVSLENKFAEFNNNGEATEEDVKVAIEDYGYEVKEIKAI